MVDRMVGAATGPWGWMSGITGSERSMVGDLVPELVGGPGMGDSSWFPDIAV